MNDVSYIMFIMILFVGMGIILPYVNQTVNIGSNYNEDFNKTLLYDSVENKEYSTVSAGQVLISILKMFTWTFGTLPLFIDSFFVIIRVILVLLIYRQIRSGGG